jgi:glutaredoxin
MPPNQFKRTVLIASIAALVLLAAFIPFQTGQGTGETVVIYFFRGEGCPHCAEADPFLRSLNERYPVEVRDFEVWYDAENRTIFYDMAVSFGFEPTAVPTIFIGDRYWVGFSDIIAVQIESTVAACVAEGCRDPGAGIVPGLERVDTPPEDTPVGQTEIPDAAAITLPLIGTVSLESRSLAVSTAIIAFVDGFNPCSLWALSVLLALTLHTGSRKKVFVIGLAFILVTALVYVLFIAGLFSMFSIVSFLGWIQIVVALVALFFGLVNIKDYFWYKKGLSFTIDDGKKPGIYKRMRNVLTAGDSWGAILAATVVMAAGVSLVEFSCTAGFPVLWTNLLAAQGVDGGTFGILLLLYMLIYQIDELGIFLVAVFTLRSSRLEEKHGRVLKLVGGTLMLTLAGVMLIDPHRMSSVSSSLWIFAAAFGAAGLILVLHRQILPGFGIRIGSEEPRRRRSSRKRRNAEV